MGVYSGHAGQCPALRKAVRVPQTIAVPPAHVLCRCWLKPIVFEAMTPEEIAAVGGND